MTVPAPTVDPLDVGDRDIDPLSWSDLVAAVMEMRSCSYGRAEQYVNDVGRVEAERELEARWSANGEKKEDR
jgi:hypothetical protein